MRINDGVMHATGFVAFVLGGRFIMIAKSTPCFFLATATTPFADTWSGDGSLEFGKHH